MDYSQKVRIPITEYTVCEVGFGPGYSSQLFLLAMSRACRNSSGLASSGGRLHEFTLPLKDSGKYATEADKVMALVS